MSEQTDIQGTTESVEELRQSFFYGSRSNLNLKFVANLTDAEFGEFLSELFLTIGETVNTGDATSMIETVNFWQVEAHAGKHVEPDRFPYRYDRLPPAPLTKPLSQSRVALLTSSGHFVEGDDPEPFGVEGMSQMQAEARIHDSLKEIPTLSAIPINTPTEKIRVRHPGYPTAAAVADHQVNLPLGHLRALEQDGTIGQAHPNAFSFVGAASQLKLKRDIAPQWAEQMRDEEVDLVLLVPV